MTETKAVSVLMTAYNSQSYIVQSIESILNQTFKEFDFIIIDDASTDNTWSIIQDYVQKDSRVKAFRNQNNLDISKNRTKLINLAKSKYIVWQDADDISVPERIEKLYNFMESNPEVGICGGWIQFFDNNKNTTVRKYKADDDSLRKTIFRYSPVAQPASIIRTSVWEDIKKEYKDKFSGTEDLEMSFRIGQKFKFANLQEVILKYRQQSNSITYQKLKKLEKQTLQIRRLYYKNKAYKFNLVDYIYNILQVSTLYLMPVKIRIALFNLIRNSK